MRWRTHILELRKGAHHSIHLQRAFDRDGESVFSFSILEAVDDPSQRHVREQHWLDTLRSADKRYGFNICPIAGTCEQTKQSPETIAKRVAKLRGQKRPRTPEWTEKIRLAKIGRPLSESHKRKIGDAHRGVKRSEETGQRISAALAGKRRGPQSDAHKEKIRLANTGKVGREWTPEQRIKFSASRIGEKRKPFTEETILRMRQAARRRVEERMPVPPSQLGRKQSEESKAKRKATWAAKRLAVA